MDSMKDAEPEEVTDVTAFWVLELSAPASLEYLEDETDETLLDCGMGRLEEAEVTTGFDDDCRVAYVVVDIGFADPGVVKAEADWVVHVALPSGG